MSRRVSTRLKRKSAILREQDHQPVRRRRQVEQLEEQPHITNPTSTSDSSVDDLVDRVTNAVLEKLQTHLNEHSATGNGTYSMLRAASAVQGSAVAAPVGNSLPCDSHENQHTVNHVDNSDQVSTAAATVQGSIAAVLDNLTGGNSIVSKPKDIFVSSDIPIDMSVSDRLKTKIWAHEYVDFGLLLNSKKEHASFHLCLSKDATQSSPGQSLITLEPNQKSKHINSIDMWVSAYQIFVGVYTQKYPVEAPLLMKYGEVIRDLAARGYNWRYYDENFRYLRQKEPKAYSWGSVHWELWIRSQPPRHTFSQINSVKKIEGESKSSFRVPKGYCWKYHKGFRCVECNYKHSCPLCQKDHQMLKCNNFRPSNGKPLAANSATSNTSKGKPT